MIKEKKIDVLKGCKVTLDSLTFALKNCMYLQGQ